MSTLTSQNNMIIQPPPTLKDVLTPEELEFLRQLFDSDLPVTIKTVEAIARLRVRVREATTVTPAAAPPDTRE